MGRLYYANILIAYLIFIFFFVGERNPMQVTRYNLTIRIQRRCEGIIINYLCAHKIFNSNEAFILSFLEKLQADLMLGGSFTSFFYNKFRCRLHTYPSAIHVILREKLSSEEDVNRNHAASCHLKIIERKRIFLRKLPLSFENKLTGLSKIIWEY